MIFEPHVSFEELEDLKKLPVSCLPSHQLPPAALHQNAGKTDSLCLPVGRALAAVCISHPSSPESKYERVRNG